MAPRTISKPAGQFDCLGQEIEWFPSANEGRLLRRLLERGPSWGGTTSRRRWTWQASATTGQLAEFIFMDVQAPSTPRTTSRADHPGQGCRSGVARLVELSSLV